MKSKKTKHTSTWMDTLPFDMENQTDNFLLAISRTHKYMSWEMGYKGNLTEVELKLFKLVHEEIIFRKATKEDENTSPDLSSVSSTGRTDQQAAGMDRTTNEGDY